MQRPIPVWLGGQADPVLRRVAARGDGWFPQLAPGEQAREALDRVRSYAGELGRDPAEIGIEARVGIRNGDPSGWPEFIEGWRKLGATHIGINTMGLGLRGADHVDAIARFHRDLVA